MALRKMLRPRVRVSRVLPATPDRVWEDVRDISSHVEWMADAVAITFKSRQREGVGTTFDCLTRIGPFAVRDRMEVTEWVDRKAIGIRHTGLIKGDGKFTLKRKGRKATRFTWTERLSFPWWMGGPPAALMGGQVLRLIWRRNLRALGDRFKG